jgi:hypothetical protein
LGEGEEAAERGRHLRRHDGGELILGPGFYPGLGGFSGEATTGARSRGQARSSDRQTAMDQIFIFVLLFFPTNQHFQKKKKYSIFSISATGSAYIHFLITARFIINKVTMTELIQNDEITLLPKH